MLDDLKYIHEKDVQDALGVVEKQWQQLAEVYDVSVALKIDASSVSNIVLAGMGGSALPAVFLQSWPGTKVPFEIVRNYTLPGYVNEKTLVISSSYSGNTEESLAALQEAEAKGAQIVVMTAGGALTEQATAKDYPLFKIPGGLQPRMASFYFLAAFVQLLEPLGLIEVGSHEDLQKAAKWLGKQVGGWRADAPTATNQAKQTAQELMGKTVIVYSGPLLFSAANKWKICINENGKNLAWCNQYPEFNHNEFMGWVSHPVQKLFAVVEIRSSLENPRVQKRFTVTERLLSGLRPSPHVIEPLGDTILEQLLWTASLGDFVSVYLALLNGINPSPVALVEKLKKQLG